MDTSIETTDAADPGPRKGRVTARYGVVAEAGFQPLPDVLLWYQFELGIRSEDLNVLLHILAHWYSPSRAPFPSAKRIANRMGVSERTVERSLTHLRRQGLIKRVESIGPHGGKAHDVRPLIERLKPFAEDVVAKRQRQEKRS
jgi:predicted transcriptional regulator